MFIANTLLLQNHFTELLCRQKQAVYWYGLLPVTARVMLIHT